VEPLSAIVVIIKQERPSTKLRNITHLVNIRITHIDLKSDVDLSMYLDINN
jgi:hypothetical protein